MSNATPIALPWHRREDTWAIFIALGLVLAVTTGFFLGASPFVGATALILAPVLHRFLHRFHFEEERDGRND